MFFQSVCRLKFQNLKKNLFPYEIKLYLANWLKSYCVFSCWFEQKKYVISKGVLLMKRCLNWHEMHNHMHLRNYIHIHKNVEIPSMMKETALTSAIWLANPSNSSLCLLSGLFLSCLLSIRKQQSTKLSLHLLPFLLYMCLSHNIIFVVWSFLT